MGVLMEIKKAYLRSLVIFLGGLLLLVAVDYCLRFSSGVMHGLGMPEMIWFASQMIIAGISMCVFLLNIKLVALGKKLSFSFVFLLSAGVIYLVVIYGYVLLTRVDSF
jgi:hypothetical protein